MSPPVEDTAVSAARRRDSGSWRTFDGPATAAAGPIAPGTRIQHYELIRELGAGGMGSVYLARDMRLGRRVAIKFLNADSPEFTQRFILEAQTTAACSHENIVIIYEVGEYGGSPFMVLEYLQGQTLSKTLANQPRVPAPRAVELIVPVVRALVTAHEQGIVHRDLKPDNIVITDTGAIKVLDFGIAKVMQGEGHSIEQAREKENAELAAKTIAEGRSSASRSTGESTTDLTRSGAILGTLAFMAPEQWRTNLGIDHRADIWAVGIMLFRMLAGQHPLAPLTGMQLYVTAQMDDPMPKLRELNPQVPLALAEVVDRCLQKHKDQRFADARALLRALEPFLPGRYVEGPDAVVSESPYTGLSSFQETDAARFFGRSREVTALVNRIADRPLIGVVGPSGAGKSSFVRAGLVPALKRSGQAWEAIVVRPGRDPLSALASLVAPLLSTSSTVADDLHEQTKIAARLRAEPGFVGSVLRSRARREKRRILLFVDQFEELYTLVPDAAERLAFTSCLAAIADDATTPARVVMSIRSDFLDRVSEDQTFMAELSQGLFFLNAPDREGLRAALVQPAEMAGYRFESPEMIEHMLDHLETTPGALPLLQFAATQLWEMRDPSRNALTRASYDQIGGIAGALASHADSVIQELPDKSRALARAVMLRLVTPERTRAIVSIDELRELTRDANDVQRLVDQLVQARLLVVQTGGAGGGSVEIVHESLIHSWPTLRRWLEETQEDAAFLDQLRNSSRQWQGKGRDDELLWRGEIVEEARRFQRRFRGELPATQREFLEAIFRHQARASRRKRFFAVAGMVFIGLLFAASAVALVVIRRSQGEAEHQAVLARHAESVAKAAATEAEQRLVQVQAKELERQKAAERAEQASAELQEKNGELIDALNRAEQARERAHSAQRSSDRSAAVARKARQDALRAAQELQALLEQEKVRAKRLQSQLGSPVIETLK